MSRILIAVISLSVLGYLAYRTLYGRAPAADPEVPTERLQHVKEAAHRFEQQGQQKAEDIDKATSEAPSPP
jgi:hypothetical protein